MSKLGSDGIGGKGMRASDNLHFVQRGKAVPLQDIADVCGAVYPATRLYLLSDLVI